MLGPLLAEQPLMPVLTWCWRCQMDIPMLDDVEWELLAPHLNSSIGQLKEYRQRTGASLAEAYSVAFGQTALTLYAQMTGFEETNLNALHHHRRSLYGPDCAACGKPLRTPQASFCAACGAVPVASTEQDATS